MHAAVAFLAELRRLVPPDVGNHALLLDGEGVLTAQVRHHQIREAFRFDLVDLDRAPAEVAAEIAELIGRNFA